MFKIYESYLSASMSPRLSETAQARLTRLGVRLNEGSVLTVDSLSESVLSFLDGLPFCIEHADCRADPSTLGTACKEARLHVQSVPIVDVSQRVRHCEEHEDCLSSPALARSCAKRDNCKTFGVPYLDWVRPFQPPLHHERLVVDGVESLSSVDSGSFLTGDLAFVRSSSMMYTLVRDSTAAVNGETVVASNTVSNTSNAPQRSGHWIAMR